MNAVPLNVLVDALAALKMVKAEDAASRLSLPKPVYMAVLHATSALGWHVEQMLAAQSATVTTEAA